MSLGEKIFYGLWDHYNKCSTQGTYYGATMSNIAKGFHFDEANPIQCAPLYATLDWLRRLGQIKSRVLIVKRALPISPELTYKVAEARFFPVPTNKWCTHHAPEEMWNPSILGTLQEPGATYSSIVRAVYAQSIPTCPRCGSPPDISEISSVRLLHGISCPLCSARAPYGCQDAIVQGCLADSIVDWVRKCAEFDQDWFEMQFYVSQNRHAIIDEIVRARREGREPRLEPDVLSAALLDDNVIEGLRDAAP